MAARFATLGGAMTYENNGTGIFIRARAGDKDYCMMLDPYDLDPFRSGGDVLEDRFEHICREMGLGPKGAEKLEADVRYLTLDLDESRKTVEKLKETITRQQTKIDQHDRIEADAHIERVKLLERIEELEAALWIARRIRVGRGGWAMFAAGVFLMVALWCIVMGLGI